jgi:hypothetical protein
MTGIKFKSMFFDRKAVIDAVDKATRKVLSKFGAFVRTSARSSIRTAKGRSKPGRPPHSHSGLLKRFLFFGWDPSSRSVVIGPEKLNGKNYGDAPDVLEHGGDTVIKGYPLSRAQIKKYPNGKKIIIKKRPYMDPALEKNIDLLPPMWRNSVKPA